MGATEAPAFSIVTPSLNQGRYLADALDSVIAQGHPRVEHIVVDGGSTDGSAQILERYAGSWPHVRVLEDVPPRGQSAAVNVGLVAARGEIVGWLNADDRYCRGTFEAVEPALDGDALLVYGDWDVIDEEGELVRSHTAAKFDQRKLLEAVPGMIAQPTVFFRRALVDRIGYLDESLQFVMDYDFWLRAARVTKFHHVPQTLAQFRHHPESKTISRRRGFYPEARRVSRAHGGPFFSTAFRRRWLEAVLGRRLATHIVWHLTRGSDAAAGYTVVQARPGTPRCPLCRRGLLGGRP